MTRTYKENNISDLIETYWDVKDGSVITYEL